MVNTYIIKEENLCPLEMIMVNLLMSLLMILLIALEAKFKMLNRKLNKMCILKSQIG